jgi:hypothetical protein
MQKSRLITSVIALLLILAGVAHAQTIFNQNDAQAENQKRLGKYRWHTSVVLTVKGKLWANSSFQSRYDQAGKLVLTQVGGGEVDPNLGLQPVKRAMRQAQKERIDSFVVALIQQVRNYTEIDPAKAEAAMSRATREPGTGEMQGTHRLNVHGVVIPEDQVTIWVDAKTGIQRRMEVESIADGQKFKSTWTFAQLPNGIWYPAKRLDDVPGKQLQLTSVNSSFF